MDISKHLAKAEEAVRKKNFDYAITIYNQVLAVKPDHGQARTALRQAVMKRFEYKKTPPLLAKVLGLPQFISMGLCMITRNKAGMIRACERYLVGEPHNRRVHHILGKALSDAGHLNSAVAVFEFLTEIDPKDTEALKSAGMLKYQLQDLSGALELYEKALALNPRDAEAERMRKNLAAEGTLQSGAYATATSTRELIREKDEAAHLQRRERIHRTAQEIEADIAHWQKALELDGSDKRASRELASLYLMKKDYDSARTIYEALLEAEPGSFEIRCALGDLEIKAYDDEIATLEKRVHKGGVDSPKEDLDALKEERLQKQVEEYAWRVKDHPTDLSLWYDYGRFVFKAKKVDAALEAFQHAVKDPRYKIPSLHMLGKSFLIKGLFDLASKQLLSALDASGGVSEKSKAIVYDLGRVAQQSNKPEEALDWYLKIFEIDINYRDIAARIEGLKK